MSAVVTRAAPGDMTSAPGAAVSPAPGVPEPAVQPRSMIVDARGITASGIGRYLREVLKVVLRDPRFGPVSLVGPAAPLHAFLEAEGCSARVVPFEHHFYSPAGYAAWLRLRVAGALRADGAFFPHFDVPPTHGSARTVVTVHDLAHFRLAGAFHPLHLAAAGIVMRRAIRRAVRVVTGSEHARADIVAWYPAAAPKLLVVPHGADLPGAARPVAVEEAAGLGRFILCVGNRKPHKNLEAAVEVLARLRPRFPDLRLVLAGPPASDDHLERRIDSLGLGPAVVDLGLVEDETLRALYGAASCFLFPSVFEGFGLPVLEAMGMGAPVVSSSAGPLPEVAGDAALLAPPHDHDALAACVARILEDEALARSLIDRGRARAAEFTWARAGRRTADVLWEVASVG